MQSTKLAFPVLALALALAAPRLAPAQCPVERFEAPVPGLCSSFGRSLAADGGRLLVGQAPPDNFCSGRAHVFERTPGGYVHRATLIPSNSMDGDGFGDSVDLDGHVAVVGSGQGLYVFEEVGGLWTETAILPAHGGGTYRTYDLDGDRVAFAQVGGVSIYARSGAGWTLQATIATPPGLLPTAVALSGGWLAIGFPYEDVAAHGEAGFVHVMRESAAGWSLDAVLDGSPTTPRGLFGSRMLLEPGRLFVTEPSDQQPEYFGKPGMAHVFERDAAGWTRTAALSGSLPGTETVFDKGVVDLFGMDLALGDGRLVVVAPAARNPNGYQGVTYVFEPVGNGWVETAHLGDPGSLVGTAVAAAGEAIFTSGRTPDPWVRNVWRFEPGLNARSYCVSSPNSVGPGARIDYRGSLSLAGPNGLWLWVDGAPPGETAYFFYGPTATQLPFGAGVLCVGAPWYRFPPNKVMADGHAQRKVDLEKPPAGAGPGALEPGATWYFQLAYRDGGALNTSDGLRLTFCR